MRFHRLLLLAPLLSACGLISLPEQTGNDLYVVNDLGPFKPSQVAYMDANQLEYLKIPKLPYQQVTFDAVGTYYGTSPRLRLQFFALNHRPDCPQIESSREGFTGALLCEGPGGGEYLTELLVSPNSAQSVSLKNPILDQAVRDGTLYLGARILEGNLAADEMIKISSIRFRGRL
ncbi:hypothetical protein [Deinococcus aquatilis]|jgi:hypothetical protein|uniref:hypothetical protein n=1 Tax=Deinococcus aquatilis TaxID=519440 RepID=UPI0012FA97B8|nr:hypothetical protein [Deinococcus aquatilis]